MSGRIFENIRDIYLRVSRAAMKADRDPSGIEVVAVTKTVPPDLVREAVESGLRLLGENRVQEAKAKIPLVEERTPDSRLSWHLIGHLQKNKARDAVRLFDLIHSVDSGELAGELDRQAEKIGKIQRVLVQVKLSGEISKSGVAPEALLPLLTITRTMTHLCVEGLMTIPPLFEDAAAARPYFSQLRMLRDRTEAAGFVLPVLSMGMSHDFEAAIEEGATMVRIGTAIFGERS